MLDHYEDVHPQKDAVAISHKKINMVDKILEACKW